MCGRFNIIPDAEAWIAAADVVRDTEVFLDLSPRYNVAPSQDIPAIRVEPHSHERQACLLHWGLIPSWAKDRKIGNRMINARAETVADKPAFRAAFKRRRCLLPASGFYEWQRVNGKQPYNIRRTDGRPLYFAGLWEHWAGEEGDTESCTIIVTAANEAMARVHDRMPVILGEDQIDSWLDPEETDRARLTALLQPYGGALEIYPVSRAVNSPRNDAPDLIRPLA